MKVIYLNAHDENSKQFLTPSYNSQQITPRCWKHNPFSLVAYLQVCLQEQGNSYWKKPSSCEWFEDILINSVEE